MQLTNSYQDGATFTATATSSIQVRNGMTAFRIDQLLVTYVTVTYDECTGTQHSCTHRHTLRLPLFVKYIANRGGIFDLCLV